MQIPPGDPVTSRTKEPSHCTSEELEVFEGLVRQGFRGSDEALPSRIRRAKQLAFSFAEDGSPAGIAGLKAPDRDYREDVFKKAGAPGNADEYRLELGWVYVLPAHRRTGIASRLCQLLLALAPTSLVFATTRPDNAPMTRILLELGFKPVGRPFPRRDEELVLFLRRPGPMTGGPSGKTATTL